MAPAFPRLEQQSRSVRSKKQDPRCRSNPCCEAHTRCLHPTARPRGSLRSIRPDQFPKLFESAEAAPREGLSFEDSRRAPLQPTATSNDRSRHCATKDSHQRQGGLMPIADPQLPLSPVEGAGEFHQEECPSSSSACAADRLAAPSCPARCAPSTCRSLPVVDGVEVSRPERHTRVFRVHHAT